MPEEHDIAVSKAWFARKVDAVKRGQFSEILRLAGFHTLTLIVLSLIAIGAAWIAIGAANTKKENLIK